MLKFSIAFFLAIVAVDPSWAWQIDLSSYTGKPITDCENSAPCSRVARWQCLSWACGKDGNQKPTDCYDQLGNVDLAQVDTAICEAVREPDYLNYRAVVDALPGATIDNVAEGVMMVRAIRGDADGCKQGIWDHVGLNTAKWTPFWVAALSGCRIVAGKRSFEQEEKDFETWNDVDLGKKECGDIKNYDMKSMCEDGILLNKNRVK